MILRYLFRLLLVASLLVIAGKVDAQYGSFGLTDARQLGLGNTYVSNSRELYAAGKNPALLAYQVNDRKLDILFPNLSARAYNVQKVSDFLNDYFSQRPLEILTGIDGSVIKNALANSGKLYFGLQIGYLAAGYTPNDKIGSFSLAMKDYLNGFLRLPQGVVEYDQGGRNIRGLYLRDFGFVSSWMRAYELSYGRIFRTDRSSGISSVYAGIGLKYYAGFLYHNIEFSAGLAYEDESGVLSGSYLANSLSARSDDIDFDNAFKGEEVVSNVPFMDPVGNGFGLDLGISLLLEPGVMVAASLTDAGMIQWRGKTKKTVASGLIHIDSTLTIDDIDSIAAAVKIEKQTDDNFRTRPPSAVHLGFSFMIGNYIRNFPGKLNLAVELHQGIATSLENPEHPRVALGIDWKPGKKWPVFLTGLTNGLQEDLTWSVGIGYELKFLELYLASPNILPVFKGTDLQTMSISACWHFVKSDRKVK